MTYNACSIGLPELLKSNFSVFPVPSNNKVYAQVNGTNITSYSVTDMTGKVIAIKSKLELPVLELNAADYKSGVYILKVATTYGEVQQQFIIE
jgi:hypothetical protein